MMNRVSFLSKEFRIKVFGAGWWFYVVLTALCLFLLTVFGKGLAYEERFRLILILSIIELVILRIYKFSLKDIRSNYNYFNELPCYLCNQSTLLCIIASYTGNQHIMAFCIIIGTFGAILAFVMPDSYNRDQLFYSKQAFGFYGYHGLLIATCFGFYAIGLYEAGTEGALWGMFFTFVLACIAHAMNCFLRKSGLNPKANYVFTWEPDNGFLEKLYRICPHRLLYLIPVMLGFGALGWLMLFLLP